MVFIYVFCNMLYFTIIGTVLISPHLVCVAVFSIVYSTKVSFAQFVFECVYGCGYPALLFCQILWGYPPYRVGLGKKEFQNNWGGESLLFCCNSL